MKTLDQDFAHFLAYQNWTDLPQDVIEKLLVAYEHGDSRGRRAIEDAPETTLTWGDFNRGLSIDDDRLYAHEWEEQLDGRRVRIVPIDQARGKGDT